jgi:hypothetical protein
MKKATRIIGMMCMAAVMVVGVSSCKKDKTTEVSSFDITLPEIKGESGIDDGSKAYIDMVAGSMKWYEGDKVMMYSIDEDYTKSQARVFAGDAGITGATNAHFAGTAMPVGDKGFFAFYPASKASSEIAQNNRVTFNVSETQNYVEDLFASTSYAGRIFMDPTGFVGAAPCEIIEPYANFRLYPIFGYINVRVKDTETSGSRSLKSVTITDNNMHLTGTMSVEIPKITVSNMTTMQNAGLLYSTNGNAESYWSSIRPILSTIGYMGNGEGHSVTLNVAAPANNGFGAQITNKNKFFLIPLRPGALMGDFTITLKFFDEEGDVVVNVPADKKYISIPGYYTIISIDLKNGGTIL